MEFEQITLPSPFGSRNPSLGKQNLGVSSLDGSEGAGPMKVRHQKSSSMNFPLRLPKDVKISEPQKPKSRYKSTLTFTNSRNPKIFKNLRNSHDSEDKDFKIFSTFSESQKTECLKDFVKSIDGRNLSQLPEFLPKFSKIVIF